jgi:glycolate oxidase FAD binding subunit
VSDVRAELEKLLGAAGVVAGRVVTACPANDDEAIETIRFAARDGRRFVPLGLASKTFPAGMFDFALSTRRIAGIVAYEPGDGTLSARAGTRMADLESAVRQSGNHLTPRIAAPERSTLGGVLAAGQSGLDRTRYGPARHHVLGMRVALADGSVAKSGGRLVKNVTGYDMHRLYCGSRGSLCVILEASMRLFAGFERETLLTAAAVDRSRALELAAAVESLAVQPLAIRAENVLDQQGAWRVHVLLAGRHEVVEWGRRTVLARIPGAEEGVETIERVRDAELAPGRRPNPYASGRRSRLPAALARFPADVRMIIEPAVPIAWIFGDEAGVTAAEPSPGSVVADRLKQSFDPRNLLPAMS